MKSFLQRVLPAVFGHDTDRKDARDATPDHRQSPVVAPSPEALTASAPQAVAGARRLLIASSGEVIGFEFRIPDDTLLRLKRRSDPRAQAAHVAAVMASARLITQSGRTGLARVPAEWLVHVTALDTAPGAMVALEVSEAPSREVMAAMVEVVQQLRAHGAKVGWSDALILPLQSDFVVVHQDEESMATVLKRIEAWPDHLRGRPTLVTDMANVEGIELALASGITYVCGALAPQPGGIAQKDALPVAPEVKRVGHLLNQLVTGAETEVIISQIKGDVGLSYRLLRRINSASFAQLGAGATIDQAVLMLGRNELYRWLSVLLVQFAGSRKASSALQEVALWRSRLLELLAIERREDIPGQFFTLGLASMLGLLLKMNPADVVSTLNLPEPAQQALLAQTGPWHSYLQVAVLVESQLLEDAGALTDQFGGVERVLALSDEAWAWAAQHTDKAARGEAPKIA